MVTGERGQHAAAMMVGEVDRRETADAVKLFLLGAERMLRRVIFDRERAYAALKYDSGSCQNAKRARFGLSVNQNERQGPVFGPGGRFEGDARAKARYRDLCGKIFRQLPFPLPNCVIQFL
jgi:hypothetical protein